MRVRFKPSPEQRVALSARLARLQQPATLREILRGALPEIGEPSGVRCAVQSVSPDRFVLRAWVDCVSGEEREYALKIYSDDFAGKVWAHSQALAEHHEPNQDGLCLASGFVPQERMLIFPWVRGVYLSDVVDERRPGLLRRAARIAARLHRTPIVPEAPTSAEALLEEARLRSERLCRRWPDAERFVAPLLAALGAAFPWLEPVEPAPVHGDLASSQFLWTGQRLVLLDLDMFGYTDPAYDVGHFLAQLERRCLLDPLVAAHRERWLTAFRESYFAAMLNVSARNAKFYHGLTLLRKLYIICRRETSAWPQLVPLLARQAQAAFEEVMSPEKFSELVPAHG